MMHRGKCKECGGAFWESYAGARGEDLCDDCEDRGETRRAAQKREVARRRSILAAQSFEAEMKAKGR